MSSNQVSQLVEWQTSFLTTLKQTIYPENIVPGIMAHKFWIAFQLYKLLIDSTPLGNVDSSEGDLKSAIEALGEVLPSCKNSKDEEIRSYINALNNSEEIKLSNRIESGVRETITHCRAAKNRSLTSIENRQSSLRGFKNAFKRMGMADKQIHKPYWTAFYSSLLISSCYKFLFSQGADGYREDEINEHYNLAGKYFYLYSWHLIQRQELENYTKSSHQIPSGGFLVSIDAFEDRALIGSLDIPEPSWYINLKKQEDEFKSLSKEAFGREDWSSAFRNTRVDRDYTQDGVYKTLFAEFYPPYNFKV